MGHMTSSHVGGGGDHSIALSRGGVSEVALQPPDGKWHSNYRMGSGTSSARTGSGTSTTGREVVLQPLSHFDAYSHPYNPTHIY